MFDVREQCRMPGSELIGGGDSSRFAPSVDSACRRKAESDITMDALLQA